MSLSLPPPAATHFDLAREALLTGRQVLVAKPIALQSREAQELVDIGKRKERILTVDRLSGVPSGVSEAEGASGSGKTGEALPPDRLVP